MLFHYTHLKAEDIIKKVMKRIFLILVPLILFSSLIKAEPNKLFLELMNEPVDRLTYGLFRCDLLLEKRESLVNSFRRPPNVPERD